ncbi:hypothetical protein CY0110_17372 [Crocosphaera chwakensis CCY0110]|uniref:Uncharacterized protein n=1 Tax=Crocosphaera chwakensis CCY0110 TaxID=391612 RepID=A3IIF6_9CHRO|nr:hypothetical protein CY0110_17372 [Crocosphaera chwakensis CCY0110]
MTLCCSLLSSKQFEIPWPTFRLSSACLISNNPASKLRSSPENFTSNVFFVLKLKGSFSEDSFINY